MTTTITHLVPKRSVRLHPSLLELVDSFRGASTAFRLMRSNSIRQQR